MTKIRNTAQTLKSLHEMKKTTTELSSASRKLATGKRVVTASDDAASLAISVKIEAVNRSKAMAARNANDAISLFQIMDGGLDGIGTQIVRLRELAISAASDTNSDQERGYLDLERASIVEEIKRFSESIEFGGRKIFAGEAEVLDIQYDAQADENNRYTADMTDMVQTPYALGLSDIKFDSKLHANLSLAQIDGALDEVSKSRAKVGSMMSAVQSHINKLENDQVNLSAANSRLVDADYAKETATYAVEKIKQTAQVSSAHQLNSSKKLILKLLG